MKTSHWNPEKQEQLKEYLDAAHKAAKEYLSVHNEADSSIVYRISDDAAKEYSKNPSIINTQPIADYVISYIREKLKYFPLDKKGKRKNIYGKAGLPECKLKEIEEMLKQGYKYVDIMHKCNVASGTVSKVKSKMKTAEKNETSKTADNLVGCNTQIRGKEKPSNDLSKMIALITSMFESNVPEFNFVFPVKDKKFSVRIREVKDYD